MLRIGLTGGIGSGKSTVARIFEVLGIPVYYADEAARKLMNEHKGLKQKIRESFGDNMYVNGVLDRKQLASVVFNTPGKLAVLNALVHPLTISDAEAWMAALETAAGQPPPYTIKEAALIFESGAQTGLSHVIGVYAPTPLRIQRVMHRDHISREAVISRMNKQLDEDIKIKLCDFVIHNDEQQLLVPQVMALHEKLTALSSKK